MNHGHHLVSWYGTAGMGGVLHTVNPRLFDEQLVYIVNHAGDRMLCFDAAFLPIVERLKEQLPTVEHFEIGREHVCTPGTNAHIVCRLLLERKNRYRRDNNIACIPQLYKNTRSNLQYITITHTHPH